MSVRVASFYFHLCSVCKGGIILLSPVFCLYRWCHSTFNHVLPIQVASFCFQSCSLCKGGVILQSVPGDLHHLGHQGISG